MPPINPSTSAPAIKKEDHHLGKASKKSTEQIEQIAYCIIACLAALTVCGAFALPLPSDSLLQQLNQNPGSSLKITDLTYRTG